MWVSGFSSRPRAGTRNTDLPANHFPPAARLRRALGGLPVQYYSGIVDSIYIVLPSKSESHILVIQSGS